MFKEVVQYGDLDIAALFRRSDRSRKSRQWCIDGAEARIGCILLQQQAFTVRIDCWFVQRVVLHWEIKHFWSCCFRCSHLTSTRWSFSGPWLSRESDLILLFWSIDAISCSFRNEDLNLWIFLLLRRAGNRQLDFTAFIRITLWLLVWPTTLIA